MGEVNCSAEERRSFLPVPLLTLSEGGIVSDDEGPAPLVSESVSDGSILPPPPSPAPSTHEGMIFSEKAAATPRRRDSTRHSEAQAVPM